MKPKYIEGQWMHWLQSVREGVGRELTTQEISSMMALYIQGKPWSDGIKKLEENK